MDQIVLVDDCSSDNSYSIAEELVKNSDKISLTKTIKNEGSQQSNCQFNFDHPCYCP